MSHPTTNWIACDLDFCRGSVSLSLRNPSRVALAPISPTKMPLAHLC